MSLKLKKGIPSAMVFFILLYPKCLDYIPQALWIIKIIYMLQIIISLYCISNLVISRGLRINRELCVLIGLFAIFNMSYTVSDLQVGVFSQTLTINLRRFLVMCGMAIYLEKQKENKKYQILKVLFYYLSILMMVNLACDILLPNGIAKISMYSDEGYLTWSDSVGFLDADNRVSLFGLLYIYVSSIYIYLQKGNHKKRIVWPYILAIINIIIAKSGSGIIALTVLLAYQMIARRKSIIKSILTWKSIVIFVILTGLFVSGKFAGLLLLLGNTFNKGVTLSGRTLIWVSAIDKIIKSPIWGYGTLEGGAFFKIGTYTWYSHNQYLDLWLQGGVFCLLSFFMILVFLNKTIRLGSDGCNYKSFVLVVLAFLVMGIAEHFIIRNYYQFWMLVCVAFSLRDIKKGELFNGE